MLKNIEVFVFLKLFTNNLLKKKKKNNGNIYFDWTSECMLSDLKVVELLSLWLRLLLVRMSRSRVLTPINQPQLTGLESSCIRAYIFPRGFWSPYYRILDLDHHLQSISLILILVALFNEKSNEKK